MLKENAFFLGLLTHSCSRGSLISLRYSLARGAVASSASASPTAPLPSATSVLASAASNSQLSRRASSRESRGHASSAHWSTASATCSSDKHRQSTASGALSRVANTAAASPARADAAMPSQRAACSDASGYTVGSAPADSRSDTQRRSDASTASCIAADKSTSCGWKAWQRSRVASTCTCPRLTAAWSACWVGGRRNVKQKQNTLVDSSKIKTQQPKNRQRYTYIERSNLHIFELQNVSESLELTVSLRFEHILHEEEKQ